MISPAQMERLLLIVLGLATIATAANHSNPVVYYYDLKDGSALPATKEDTATAGASKGGFAGRYASRSNGCTCQTLTCGCCTGIYIQQFNFQREGCMNFTYNPLDFSLAMNMFMNNNPVYSNIISAKNPPPLCIPYTPPYFPAVEFCARLFDVHTPGQNLQMCLDFETRVEHAPVFVLHFDCMRMGTSGFALVKPGSVPDALSPFSSTTITVSSAEGVTDVDVYDEVTEMIKIGGKE